MESQNKGLFKHQKTEFEQDSQDFDHWNNVQKHLEAKGQPYSVKAGEVYWVGLGKNLGSEMDGKGKRFARPMIVIKPINRNMFIGVPLTSKPHYWPGFMKIKFCDQEEFIVLMQVRVCSSKRLYNRMGRLDCATLDAVKKALREYLELDSTSDYDASKTTTAASRAKARRVTTVDKDGHETPPTAGRPKKTVQKIGGAALSSKKNPDEKDLKPVTTEDEGDSDYNLDSDGGSSDGPGAGSQKA